MSVLKMCLTIAWLPFLASALAAGQEMVLQYSFPTEAMLAQDIYLRYGAGLACDRAGNVWVVDSGQGVLLQFDPAGQFLKKAGRQGQGPGEFSRPGTIHITEDGDLLVLDTGNVRMAVLSAEGEFKRSFKFLRRYEDFCVDKGRIYLLNNNPREDGKTVDVLSMDGDFLESLGEDPGFGPVVPYNARVANMKGISGDQNGRLLVGWTFFPIVHVLDAGRKETVARVEIDDPRLKDRYRRNLGQLNVQEAEIWNVVLRTRAHRGGFLASVPGERIELLDCGLDGKVRATYWAPMPEEDYLGRDFICREDGNTTWVYILQTRPESKVNVYKVEPK
ncbi:MAG: 6-bladed beta-propeller [Candidatus Aminicenantes bacterium]|nr:6-bladed beta-propeller [Candidatus Aminicenantes bacterium]